MKIEIFNFKKSCKEIDFLFDGTNRSSNKILKIKTLSGWRTLDSPYDPYHEAQDVIGNEFSPETGVVLIGFGSGYFVSELLKRGISKLTLITPYKIIADLNAGIISDDKYPDGKADIIISDVFDHRIKEKLKAVFDREDNKKIIIHPRESRTLPGFFNPLSVYAESLGRPAEGFVHEKKIRRVLFPCSGQIIEKEVIHAFRKKGVEVFDTDSFTGKNIDPKAAWDIIEKFKPDLIMSTNNKGSDREGYIPAACRFSGVKWATWFLDDPRFIVSKNEVFSCQERFGFCWDVSGAEALKDIGFSNISMLPLATDPDIFHPGQGDQNLDGRVIYVGSPGFGNEDKYFSGLKNNKKVLLLCEYFEDKILRERSLPTSRDLMEAANDLRLNIDLSSETFLRVPAYAMYKANLEYRVNAIQALSELNPVVYGEGWEGLLPGSVEIRPYADYYRDLPGLYQSDAVHISLTHLQMKHYPNQRIFDAGACGRIVLGDRVTGWNELFGPGFDQLVFDDFKDLKEKARMFSQSKALRKDYGDRIQKEVLLKHTYTHRIESIIEKIF